MRAPSGLLQRGRGRKFWRDITGVFELTTAELSLLEETCRTFDAIDTLQQMLDEQGPMLTGSMGQKVLNPAFAEIRGQRVILHKLITALQLPDDDGKTIPTGTTLRAVGAAANRWRGHVKGM